jgi:hypothetical protein
MYLTVRDPRRDRNLQRFVRLCAINNPADQLSRLRDALTLVKTTRSLDMVEVMIAAGAFESAALAVIGDNATWMVSKGGDGRCLASLILPGMSEEVTSEGATPALALLGAWASAALVSKGSPVAEPSPPARPTGSLLH